MNFFKSLLYMIFGLAGIILGFFLVIIFSIGIFGVFTQGLQSLQFFNFHFILGVIFILAIFSAVAYYIYKSPVLIKRGLDGFKNWVRRDSK